MCFKYKSILETLKLEGKAVNGLHSLGLKGDMLRKFLSLSIRSDDNTYALDIRHSAIIVSNFIYFSILTTEKFQQVL